MWELNCRGYLGVVRELYRALTDAKLPTGFSLFVGSRTWKCVGVMEEEILESVWFLACAVLNTSFLQPLH